MSSVRFMACGMKYYLREWMYRIGISAQGAIAVYIYLISKKS